MSQLKVDRLETHDRYLDFAKKQEETIVQGVEDCMFKNSLSLAYQEHSPYIYIFGHPRTHDDGVTKRMLWQPRLTKPEPQTNSYLFRAKSKQNSCEVCWLLPPKEMWNQYKKGNVTESNMVEWSIFQYLNKFNELSSPHKDDLPEEKCREILKSIISNTTIKNRKIKPN